MTQGQTISSATIPQARIYGAGEMPDRIRSFDWTTHALGPIQQWPDVLLTTLNTMLSSHYPMFLFWGPELFQFYNDAYRAFLGSDKHPSALGQSAPAFWQEAWHLIGPMIEGVMHSGDPGWDENQLVPVYRDGVLADVYWTYCYSPVRDVAGAIVATIVVGSDTTSQVLTERRFHDMLDAATDGVLSIDRNWTITDLNPKGRRLLAASGELIGKDFWAAFPGSANKDSGYEKTYRAAMQDRVPGDFEAFYPAPLNAWFQVNVRPTIDGITLFFSDISARKTAENAVVAERAQLLEILQQAPAFFALLKGPDHIIGMVNSLYLRLINQTDVVGKPLRDVLPAASGREYIKILDRVYAGERFIGYESPYQVYGEEGAPPDERFVDFVYQPLRESDGNISGIILLGVDVTDRKKAQDVLLETEKLAAVGRLAGSIAHEINNPLESVTNLLYLVRSMTTSQEVDEYLETADRELRRVSAITNQTLRFHKQASNPLECTGEQLADGVLSLYRGRIVSSKIHLDVRYRGASAVRCFEGEIRQVISNLVGNSLDAMSDGGGHLLVRSREGTDQRTGRKGLILTVADTGPGMSAGVQQQAFRAFFTTKGFVGTGLGLWICREIVNRHDGRLLLRSSQREGHTGTVISLFLPFDAVSR